jgi:hypothetical protein
MLSLLAAVFCYKHHTVIMIANKELKNVVIISHSILVEVLYCG